MSLASVFGLLGVAVITAIIGPSTTASQERKPEGNAERLTDTGNFVRIPSRVEGVLDTMDVAVKPGQKVEKGQSLARMDSALSRNLMMIGDAKVAAAKADRDAAKNVVGETETRFKKISDDKVKNAAISDMEVRGAKLLWETKQAELRRVEEMVKIAELEREQAKIRLDMHDIRSPANGVVRQVLKRPGEAVRSLETVVVIEVPGEK